MVESFRNLKEKIESSIAIQTTMLVLCVVALVVSPFSFAISGSMALATLATAVNLSDTIEKKKEITNSATSYDNQNKNKAPLLNHQDCAFKLTPSKTPNPPTHTYKQR